MQPLWIWVRKKILALYLIWLWLMKETYEQIYYTFHILMAIIYLTLKLHQLLDSDPIFYIIKTMIGKMLLNERNLSYGTT